MGHANVSNLSALFINLLYAKGRVSIDDAVTVAMKRGETVHASEAEYEDDGMLAMALNDVVAHLTHKTGSGYSHGGKWEGPWIEPEFYHHSFSYNRKRTPETDTMKELLRQCCEAHHMRPFGNVLDHDENLFGVCADAIQDAGDDEWAWRVRTFPRQCRAWRMHELEAWKFFDDDANWKAFDAIKWMFREGWRKRYRDIPRLASVSH